MDAGRHISATVEPRPRRPRSLRLDAAALIWLGIVCACLLALLLVTWRGRRSTRQLLVLWIPAVAVLGPIGLLVWLIAARSGLGDAEVAPRTWPRALVEVVGDLPPYVVGLVAALLAVILVPTLGGGNPLQHLVIYYGLPLAGGLLLIHGPLLAVATRSGYGRIVIRRLPTALVSTNLSLAGLLAITAPLIVCCVNFSGLGALVVLRLWAVAIPSAPVGGSAPIRYRSGCLIKSCLFRLASRNHPL